MTALLAERITAGYGKSPVINDTTIECKLGTVTSIVGPNGSGKSTLLKTIVGLIKPISGRVAITGRDITGWAPHQVVRSGLAYVPQTANVFFSLSVLENLEMGSFANPRNVASRADLLLAGFPDLAAARHKKAGNLSVGQRNLLGVARALMSDPTFLLVDEPTAGLAPQNAQAIWDEIVRIAGLGKGVLVVEQNVDSALRYSDWCYVLVGGRSRLSGPSAEVQKADLHNIFLGLDTRGEIVPEGGAS